MCVTVNPRSVYHHEVYLRQKTIVTITTLQNKRKTMKLEQRNIKNMHTHARVRLHTSNFNDNKSNMLQLHTTYIHIILHTIQRKRSILK